MCGTRFKDVSTPEFTKIVVDRPGIHVLQSGVAMDKELAVTFGTAELSKMVLERLQNELAKGIAPYMDVEWEDVPWEQRIYVRGRIRVLDPKERF